MDNDESLKSSSSRVVDSNPERVRSRTVQSIQYLATHVPMSVLTRLSEETKAWAITMTHCHGDGEGSIHHALNDCTTDESDLQDNQDDQDHDSVTTEDTLSELSREFDDSETDLTQNSGMERMALHESLATEPEVDELPASANLENHEVIFDTSAIPRRKMVRRGSMASIVSFRLSDFQGMPHASRTDASLLLVDISGFTRLSTVLGPEALSRAINEYFELIVNEVTNHSGDILQFAGDSLLATWRVSTSKPYAACRSLELRALMSCDECVTAAALCGAAIVSKYSEYPICVSDTAKHNERGKGHMLNVHCGISFGTLVSVHVGDDTFRRQNIFLGSSVDAIALAATFAEIGEVAACPASIEILSRTCVLSDSISSSKQNTPAVIANQSMTMFTLTAPFSPAVSDPLALRVERFLSGWDTAALIHYRTLLSLYVHPVVAANDAGDGNASYPDVAGNTTLVQTRQVEEAELRNVFVMFIAPLISVSIPGDDENDSPLFDLLNSIMNLATRELARFGGHLRQFVVDDKGLVLIATFGLRGSNFQNMVTERVLPTATTIQNCLLSEFDVKSRIGATMGNAYCGVVGGIMRHEYAILGPSVNLAARLMALPSNPGLLVDDAIRQLADRSYGFNALCPVQAKGYSMPVAIFEPISSLQRRWGRKTINFVGRTRELGMLTKLGYQIATSSVKTPARLVLVSGVAGLGKSTFVLQMIDEIQRTLRTKRKRVFVAKCVIRDSDARTPFGAISSILMDAIKESEGYQMDESSVMSNAGSINSWVSSCGVSISMMSTSKVGDRVSALCNEIGASPEFAQLVGQHLLKLNLRMIGGSDKLEHQKKASLATQMADVILRCTRNADLSIIALDDVQFADDMSFEVVQKLFESGLNLMIVCASRPLSEYKLAMDNGFWDRLNNDYVFTGRYLPVVLNPLNEPEMRKLIARTLGLPNEDVSEQLLKSTLAQTGGIPQMASVLLEHLKRNYSSAVAGGVVNDMKEFGAIAETTSATPLNQMILQEIDRFRGIARKVLNLAAVMGSSFEFSELMAVMFTLLGTTAGKASANAEALRIGALRALSSAAKKGILCVEWNGGETIDHPPASYSGLVESNLQQQSDPIPDELTCCFSHDMWRSSILGLMLDRRKSELHRAIALTLEGTDLNNTKDFTSRLLLFGHWKASGDFLETSRIALETGKMFEDLGLHKQNVGLYQEALGMWARAVDSKDAAGGFSPEVLNVISSDQLVACVKICVALGKAYLNLHLVNDAAKVYQDALGLLGASKSGRNITDRSIVFPIFSGLFLLIKLGAIKQDETCSYEQGLVAKFVDETRLHGDPIHYARALAMQSDMFARQCDFESALSTHDHLKEIYHPDCHSSGICREYGSDRAAQCLSLSAIWLVEVGRTEEALRTCDSVVSEIMPLMEPSNVHNSCVILYPLLWVLKDNGMALKAKQVFMKYVIDAFDLYFGEGATTFSLKLFNPILMLLDLDENQDAEVANLQEYLEWALCEQNLRLGETLNNAFLPFGRLADSIGAEICLLLAKRPGIATNDQEMLMKNGLRLSRDGVVYCRLAKANASLRRVLPILTDLENMAHDRRVLDEGGLDLGSPHRCGSFEC